MPDEAIVHVASFLKYRDLCSLSQTNKRLYQIASDPLVLKSHLLGLVGLLNDADASVISHHRATLQSSYWHHCIRVLLDSRKRKALPITGVRASSTHFNQKIECTLEGTSGFEFWSSTPSTPEQDESLLYQLAHSDALKRPAALVITGIEVTWYADGGYVIYNSNQLQVSIGAHEGEFPYTSYVFDVAKTEEPVVFPISPPQLVLLDAEKEVYIKLHLLGKNQTQFGGPDNYYHVVRYCACMHF